MTVEVDQTVSFKRGEFECLLDSCENVPFGSVGGLDKRTVMEAPTYIPDGQVPDFLSGYRSAARMLYGDDWETCSFKWRPVMEFAHGEVRL